MTFARPEMLYLLWLTPALVLVYLLARSRRRRILRDYARERSLAAIDPESSATRRGIRAALLLLSLTALILALSGLQYGYSWRMIERRGVSLMILMDCSKSMLSGDIKPNRLERAKREVLDLLDMLRGDKVGLVGFAGTAFLHCPLTLDYGAFRLFLSALGPDYLPVGGTDLAGAVRAAVAAFDAKDGTEKAIILITDGEGTTPGTLEAAREANEKAVRIYSIGVGSPEGAPIPDGKGGFQKDAGGNIILSRLDEDTLQKMAAQTGGAYVRSVTGDMDLEALYQQQIREKMEAQTLEGGRRKIFRDRYRWFLGLAAAALLLHLLWPAAARKAAAGLPAAVMICTLFGPGPALAADMRAQAADGLKAYQNQEYQTALDRFLQAQVEDPENPAVLYNIGNTYYKLGDFAQAGRNYEAALGAIPPSRETNLKQNTYFNLGNAQYRQGNLPEAVRNYEEALKIDPEDQDAKKNLEFVKKLMDQQKSPDQGQGEDQKDGEKKENETSQSKDGSQQQGDGNQEQNKPDQSEKREPPEQKEKEESPRYADSMKQEEKPEPDQAAAGKNEENAQARAGQKDDDRQNAMDERLLNRLQDKPGAAMIPQYRKRVVEKDW